MRSETQRIWFHPFDARHRGYHRAACSTTPMPSSDPNPDRKRMLQEIAEEESRRFFVELIKPTTGRDEQQDRCPMWGTKRTRSGDWRSLFRLANRDE
jgi:hypothetical protein